MGERWYLRTESAVGPMYYAGADAAGDLWTPQRANASSDTEHEVAREIRNAICDEANLPRTAVRVVRVGPPRRYTLTAKGRAATEPARQGVDGTADARVGVQSHAARPDGSRAEPDPGGFQVGDVWCRVDGHGYTVRRVLADGSAWADELNSRLGSQVRVRTTDGLYLITRAGKPRPHTKEPERYGVAFTHDGKPGGDVIGWAHNDDRAVTFATADEARAENERRGWTGYVRVYPSGARVAPAAESAPLVPERVTVTGAWCGDSPTHEHAWQWRDGGLVCAHCGGRRAEAKG